MLEFQHKDLFVSVLEVDDLVVEHVSVDVVELVFWNVREVVLEVLEHLVELDLLSMVVMVLDVSVVVELPVRLHVVLPVELASYSDSVCEPQVVLECPPAWSSSTRLRLSVQMVVLEEVDVSVVLESVSPLCPC